jgi:hypothetical protein
MNLVGWFYGIIGSKIRELPSLNTAIKGDFNRYSHTLSEICGFGHKDVDIITEDGKEVHFRYYKNNDAYIEAFDDSQFYNHLLIWISDNRNKVEFIASNILARGEEPNYKEESEYIYEPDTQTYYAYYTKISYVDHEEVSMIHTYDRNGNEIKRSIYTGTFEKPKVNVKK